MIQKEFIGIICIGSYIEDQRQWTRTLNSWLLILHLERIDVIVWNVPCLKMEEKQRKEKWIKNEKISSWDFTQLFQFSTSIYETTSYRFRKYVCPVILRHRAFSGLTYQPAHLTRLRKPPSFYFHILTELSLHFLRLKPVYMLAYVYIFLVVDSIL